MSEATDDLRRMAEALEATWNGLGYSYGDPRLIDWAAARIDALTEALRAIESYDSRGKYSTEVVLTMRMIAAAAVGDER